ncbi:MAG TPA: nuclear transport factor 2 family protein [Streptosporangiaceae bacterium]|nr:nuclear transport factor 2 family protein [Streptosporangiaceae bacterium]
MTSAHDQIRNLIHRYAEGIDTGRFEIWEELFKQAEIYFTIGDSEPTLLATGGDLSVMTQGIIIYGDGTPRTRHIVSNTIIEVDEAGVKATARSYNTTLQQVPDRPIEIIATARYFDSFELAGNAWHFTQRIIRHSAIDGVNRDFTGDMSHHVRRQG